jgi:phage pi2 protein 07
VKTGVPNAMNFDFKQLKAKTLRYLRTMKMDNHEFSYRFSTSTKSSLLYASVYACMIRSLYGDLRQISEKQRQSWVDYLDSFQSEDKGLFYDPVIKNALFDNSDWWGDRHLALHAVSAYCALGAMPKYRFHFLEQYYSETELKRWLDTVKWESAIPHNNDIDNKIMNIGCLLQYSRDYFDDANAARAVEFLKKYLKKKINVETGLWGFYNTEDKDQLSRMVQFAYHILPIYFYDHEEIQYKEKIIDHILSTQNLLGGYGVQYNSSACEDIDSIDILIKLSRRTGYRSDDIKQSLLNALPWVLSNMNKDGGFVFRREEPLLYGHGEMSSGNNESNMFATWFRILSLAYLSKVFADKSIVSIVWQFIKCPGLQFWPEPDK